MKKLSKMYYYVIKNHITTIFEKFRKIYSEKMNEKLYKKSFWRSNNIINYNIIT